MQKRNMQVTKVIMQAILHYQLFHLFTKPYLLTKMLGGAKMTSHCSVCVGNQVQSDSTVVPVLNAPEQFQSVMF